MYSKKSYVYILAVTIGAISYGIPASLVKIANLNKVDLIVLISSMLLFSSIILTFISHFFTNKYNNPKIKKNEKGNNKLYLFIVGFSIFGTNYFYMNSLSFISVSVAAVLLMQSVWITHLFEYLFKGRKLTKTLLSQIFLILIGTILATNIIHSHKISSIGIILGSSASICYAITLFATGSSSIRINPLDKTKIMIYGAFFLSLFFSIQNKSILQHIGYICGWGILISLFSILIPLLCFTFFMPKVPGSMGPLISSFELPSAILFSYILVGERVNIIQILGILIIVFSVSLPSIYKNFIRNKP